MRRALMLMAVAVLAGGSACGSGESDKGAGGAATTAISPTTISTSTTTTTAGSSDSSLIPGKPKIVIRHLKRSASGGHAYSIDIQYAELSRIDAKIAARANDDYRKAAEHEAQSFIDDINSQDPCTGNASCTGGLDVSITPLVSAPRAVSFRHTGGVYMPGAAHPYDINEGETVDLRDGHHVKLSEMFSTPEAKYLELLSKESRPRARKAIPSECRQSYDDNGQDGIKPTADNYANWAIAPGGFEVEFGEEQLVPHVCGVQQVLIPWSALRPQLSATGTFLSEA